MEEFMNAPVTDEAEEKVSANETKADKFKRLANSRVNNTLKCIKGISQLSSSNYEYTEDQVDKIFGALQAALDDAKSKFSKTKKEEDTGFSL